MICLSKTKTIRLLLENFQNQIGYIILILFFFTRFGKKIYPGIIQSPNLEILVTHTFQKHSIQNSQYYFEVKCRHFENLFSHKRYYGLKRLLTQHTLSKPHKIKYS